MKNKKVVTVNRNTEHAGCHRKK